MNAEATKKAIAEMRSVSKKRVVNKKLEEARERLRKESTYTVSISDYLIDIIKNGWEEEFKKHKCSFTAEGAIKAIVRAEANRIVGKKYS